MSENSDRTLDEVERRIDEKFRDTYDEPFLSKGVFELLLYALSGVFFAYHMWYGYTFALPRDQHGIVHLALVLVLWGLLKLVGADRSTTRGKLESLVYGAYAVVAVVPLYYMYSNYDDLVFRAGLYNDSDIMMGVLLIGLVLFALWSVSRLITVIASLGLIYSYYGNYMPGILQHRGLRFERIVTMNTVEMQGLLGTLLQISATWVVIFLILAGIMEKYGGMADFIKGMTRISARSKYLEIGQVAVAASMFMGSINGSTAANTATTGAFTIPLMKENGYRPELAAAIEAVASCGGQVLPPIMGAGAFLMAELINRSYAEIVVGAVAPALLFFLAVGISISLNSRVTVTQQVVAHTEERSLLERVVSFVSYFEYLGMFAVLLYWLVYVQADPMVAGFYSIVTLIALRFVRMMWGVVSGDADLLPQVKLFVRQSIEGFERGAEVTVDITILLASLGIVIRALVVTGFAQSLSTRLVILSGGVLLVLLVLSMIASILFGMGMSTTAAYMLVAILVAPSLTNIGLDPFTAHLFVFYFAIVSNITPPIALSVVIGQGIAGSSFWATAREALKMGFPMFFLPYAFLFNRELIYPEPMTVVVFALVLVAFVALSIGFIGQFRSPVSLPLRLAFVAIGVTILFVPMLAVQLLLTVAVVAGLVYLAPPRWLPRAETARE